MSSEMMDTWVSLLLNIAQVLKVPVHDIVPRSYQSGIVNRHSFLLSLPCHRVNMLNRALNQAYKSFQFYECQHDVLTTLSNAVANETLGKIY